MYTGTLGVAIISFNRPHYLQQLVGSLEKNTCLESTDFHFFQDGAVNKFSGRKAAQPNQIRLAVQCAEAARLPCKSVHVRRENVSIGIHQFEAYEWMTRRYDVVLVLEDDVVVSPHYLRIMRVLFDCVSGRNDVFSASSNFVRACPADDIQRFLSKASLANGHWWGEIFAAKRWARIRPHFMEYFDLIRGIDYAQRPHAKILELFSRRGFGGKATSQDAGKDLAVMRAGMQRARLVVNRAIYIGRQGTHCDPALYDRSGWGCQEPYVFAADETIDHFEFLEGASP